jgi:hypothetical protein
VKKENKREEQETWNTRHDHTSFINLLKIKILKPISEDLPDLG